MFGRAIHLFTLFGFSVKLDLSWFIIAILIAWSLAVGVFPFYYENLPVSTYWLMGVIGALGLFASIVFHEFAHSLVARRCGMKMKGITLFLFGGVAEMMDEPPSAKAEFWVAVAGPAASLVLVGIFYAASLIPAPDPVRGVLTYLASINGILILFNLIPAFPLDGGRILRSVLWKRHGDLQHATRLTSRLGLAFGAALIGLAVLNVLIANLIGAMWWFLLGMFLRGAARSSYQQLLVRNALQGVSVARFMSKNPITVPPELRLQQVVDDYIYTHHHKLYPITDNGQLLGCITTAEVKSIPREQWNQRTVADVAIPCSTNNSIDVRADALDALKKMNETKQSRLLVLDSGQLVGVLAFKDLLEFLSMKIELEGQ